MLFAAGLLVGLTATPLSASSADDRSTVEQVVADIDAFWTRWFRLAERPYAPPIVVTLDAPATTGCGAVDPFVVAGTYCAGDRAIYHSPPFFVDLEQEVGGFTWIAVVAHEWGHHVQHLLGVARLPGNAFELQADCLAGAYAQDARALGLLESGDITEATGMSAAGGDPIWLSQDELGAHGTNDDRITSFMRGYLDGAAVGCALPITPPSSASATAATRATPRLAPIRIDGGQERRLVERAAEAG